MKIKSEVSPDHRIPVFKHLFIYLWIGDYPDAHPANVFFTALRLGSYPHFFENCLQPGGGGIYDIVAGFNRGPYPPYDEDPGLTDQEVALGGPYMDAAVIPLSDFLAIALSFAREIIKVATEKHLIARHIVDQEWMETIQSAIPKIEMQLNELRS